MTTDRGHAMDDFVVVLFENRSSRMPPNSAGSGNHPDRAAVSARSPVSFLTLVNDMDKYCLNGTQDGHHVGSGVACTSGSDSSSGS